MTMLQIKGLNTYYGESHILRDVDMNINQGEMICLIGRNGVGKTTLLKSLIGLLTPRRGLNKPIKDLSKVVLPTPFRPIRQIISP